MRCRKCEAKGRARTRRHHAACPLRGIGTRRSVRNLLTDAFSHWLEVGATMELYRLKEGPQYNVQAIIAAANGSTPSARISPPLADAVRALAPFLPPVAAISPRFDLGHEAAVVCELGREMRRWPSDLQWLVRHRFRNSAIVFHVQLDRMSVLFGAPMDRLPYAFPTLLLGPAGCEHGKKLFRTRDGTVRWVGRTSHHHLRFPVHKPKRVLRPATELSVQLAADLLASVGYNHRLFASDTVIVNVFVPDDGSLTAESQEDLVQLAADLSRLARFPWRGESWEHADNWEKMVADRASQFMASPRTAVDVERHGAWRLGLGRLGVDTRPAPDREDSAWHIMVRLREALDKAQKEAG